MAKKRASKAPTKKATGRVRTAAEEGRLVQKEFIQRHNIPKVVTNAVAEAAEANTTKNKAVRAWEAKRDNAIALMEEHKIGKCPVDHDGVTKMMVLDHKDSLKMRVPKDGELK